MSWLSGKFRKVIVLGDFNINLNVVDLNTKTWIDMVQSFALKITITENTRVDQRSATCIDNILTNLSDSTYSAGVVDPCLSDHYGQYIKFEGKSEVSLNNTIKRKITNKGLKKLNAALINTDWSIFRQDFNANSLSHLLINVYSSSVKKNFHLENIWNMINLR